MRKFRTHYDNLQVVESASVEVIRGAYKHLAQKWHPDKHPTDSQHAEKVTKIINKAYSVLSNPEKRKEYDESILKKRKDENKPTNNHQGESKSDSTLKKTDYSKESVPNKKEILKNGGYHPWRRYFARNIDVLTSGLVAFIFMLYIIDRFLPEKALLINKALDNDFVSAFTMYALWIPIEAIFLSLLGTTPAKWIFGISISKKDNSKLSFFDALHRSFLVWLGGVGLGIPIYTIFTNYSSYQKLTVSGETSWDKEIRTVVAHKKWGVFRTISVIIFTCLTIIILSALGQENISPAESIKVNKPDYSSYNSTAVTNFPIILENVCNKDVSVALLYLTEKNRWLNIGWFTISANNRLETELLTNNNHIYYYATSSTGAPDYSWGGENISSNTGTINRVVPSGKFSDYDDINSDDTEGNTVSFRAYDAYKSHGSYLVSLECKKQFAKIERPLTKNKRSSSYKGKNCTYKSVMTNQDYIACGITPPSY